MCILLRKLLISILLLLDGLLLRKRAIMYSDPVYITLKFLIIIHLYIIVIIGAVVLREPHIFMVVPLT